MKAVLVIDAYSATCGECGLPALAHETEHHSTVYGVIDGRKSGCHARWTHISTSLPGGSLDDAVRAMRPDLQWASSHESPDP